MTRCIRFKIILFSPLLTIESVSIYPLILKTHINIKISEGGARYIKCLHYDCHYPILSPPLKPSKSSDVFTFELFSQKSKGFKILSSNTQPCRFGTNLSHLKILSYPKSASNFSEMTTPYSSHLLSAPTFQAANKMAHRIHSPLFQGFKVSFFLFVQSFLLFLYVDNRLFCTILTWVFWCIGFYFLNGLFLYVSSS